MRFQWIWLASLLVALTLTLSAAPQDNADQAVQNIAAAVRAGSFQTAVDLANAALTSHPDEKRVLTLRGIAQEKLKDNRAAGRLEMEEAGQVVFADYRRDGRRLFIDHVEAPVALRGTGAAGRLMKGVLERARADQVKVLPLCGYARAWMQRHPEYKDLAL